MWCVPKYYGVETSIKTRFSLIRMSQSDSNSQIVLIIFICICFKITKFDKHIPTNTSE